MNRQFTVYFMWVLLSSTAAGAGVDQQCTTESLSDRVTDNARIYLENRYPDGRTPGVSVLVACKGQTIFSYNSGMADIEWQQQITSNTSFRLGSISKPLTAVAILQLVEQRRIDLDKPIAEYVPLLPNYMRSVTVRQLMSHTSGLPDILLTPMLLPLARNWVSKSQVIGMQAHTPPRSAPGEKFEYSNFNYVLLAALIEHITDTKYSEYMDKTIFESLGMTRSHYDARRSILAERAKGYELIPSGQLLNAENIDMSHASAAGALLSSANDLRIWAHLLMSGQLLKPETLDMAWSPQPMRNSDPSTYGLGFNITIENGHRVIWHTGLASGFHGAISMYPDAGLTIIVLGNGFHLPSTGSAADVIAEIVLPL